MYPDSPWAPSAPDPAQNSRSCAWSVPFDTARATGITGGVQVTSRHGEGWISVPTMDKLAEPPILDALKSEAARRW
jgi:hypothetical protein